MGRYEMLLNYLIVKNRGGFGWKSDYIDRLFQEYGSPNYPWLSGIMEGMLDDLISIVGLERCIRIVTEFDSLSKRALDK